VWGIEKELIEGGGVEKEWVLYKRTLFQKKTPT
jgi:hypothetical protein